MILTRRGQKIILDRYLAALYGVPTFRFNEAVKRNRKRFLDDLIYQQTAEESVALISQIAISNASRGGQAVSTVAYLGSRLLDTSLRALANR